MEEIWKDVQGYEGRYQVSNLGRVKSLARRTCKGATINERILKQHADRDGYYRVMLCKDGVDKLYGVHRLVALAFIPNINNLPQVMHLDENNQNNCSYNLAWGTCLENNNFPLRKERLSKAKTGVKHSIESVEKMKNTLSIVMSGEGNPMYGRHHTEETKAKISEKNKGNKLSEEAKKKMSLARQGRTPNVRKVSCDGKVFDSIKQCADFYNINISTLKAWLSGRNKMPISWQEKKLCYYTDIF